MTPLLLLCAVLNAAPCQSAMPALFDHSFTSTPGKAKIPLLFRERSFTCATLAEAVNHYVDLGEEAAIKELESLSSDRITSDDVLSATGSFSRAERIAWVCRILFQPKGKEP